jgi:uncharacterized protein YbjT (DUF2867 family)
MKILLTGATGNVGAHVAAALAGRSDVRALALTEANAEALARQGLRDVVLGDLARPETLSRAFGGVDRLFLLTPFVPNQLELESNALDAAEAAGVGRVVKVSFAMDGPDGEPITQARPHREIERRLPVSEMAATVLRPEWIATNLLAQVEPIRGGQLVYPSPPHVQHNPMDPRDIAGAAVAALLADEPPTGAFDLTGPEALTLPELAGRIGGAVGREVVHVEPPIGAWRDGLVGIGVPDWWANALVELFEAFNRRVEAPVTGDLERLTGRSARPVDEFVREYLAPAVDAPARA